MHITRKALQAEREYLIRRLRAIDVLLDDDEVVQLEIPGTDPGNGSEPGFRERLRTILKDHSNGLKPAQVTTELRSEGFDLPSTSVPLGTRVSNELHRMYRAGQLHRTKAGRYKFIAH